MEEVFATDIFRDISKTSTSVVNANTTTRILARS
jgi:hypothetical protein